MLKKTALFATVGFPNMSRKLPKKKNFQEDEMPNRLGLLHVRPRREKQATDDEEVDKVVDKLQIANC